MIVFIPNSVEPIAVVARVFKFELSDDEECDADGDDEEDHAQDVLIGSGGA